MEESQPEEWEIELEDTGERCHSLDRSAQGSLTLDSNQSCFRREGGSPRTRERLSKWKRSRVEPISRQRRFERSSESASTLSITSLGPSRSAQKCSSSSTREDEQILWLNIQGNTFCLLFWNVSTR